MRSAASVVPAFQGRGLASAATALVLDEARATQTHRYVHAFPSTDNPPSNGICRKLGFTLLEVCRFEYPPDVRKLDVLQRLAS